MKYDIVIRVTRPHITVKGTLTAEVMDVTPEEARTAFDEMQEVINKRQANFFVLYERIDQEADPVEISVSEAFYSAHDALVAMQLVKV